MTWPIALLIAADFTLAAVIAFAAGWLTARRAFYDRGFRAGMARAGHIGGQYWERGEPTAVVRKSER